MTTLSRDGGDLAHHVAKLHKRRQGRVAETARAATSEGAWTVDGRTTLSREAARSPRSAEIEAHEAVHRVQFAVAGTKPSGSRQQLEAEAQLGVRKITIEHPFEPRYAAAPRQSLCFEETPALTEASAEELAAKTMRSPDEAEQLQLVVHERDAATASIQTAPPKLPVIPKPQKGEKPLGQLDVAGKVKPEDIYASFVTLGLWWFNGETPTVADAGLYSTEASIPLAPLGGGSFTVTVTKGTNQVAAKSGGSRVTGKDLRSAVFKSKRPSKKPKDVTIEVRHSPPGSKDTLVYSVQLEVRAPHEISYLGADHQANGTRGWNTVHFIHLLDNFKQPIPFMDVNEDFDVATLESGVTSLWKSAFAARTKGSTVTRGNAHWTDNYLVGVSGGTLPKSANPKPSNPKTPLGSTKVAEFKHRWYAGSRTIGKGVLVSRHIGVFYADHGAYTKVKSPV